MPRILIVDDESGIRSLLSSVFGLAGYEVRTAAAACEAMELCAAEIFDVLLSDVHMPGTNGHELVGWVARRYPEIRCALMSSFNPMACEDCPVQSSCPFLEKPFHPLDAVLMVEHLLRESPANGRCAH